MNRWIVEPSLKGRFMLIEDDGTVDGRLVADKLSREDAYRIAEAINGSADTKAEFSSPDPSWIPHPSN